MSDINDETNRPNYMAADKGTSGDNGKKKKMIIGGVVGIIVLIIVIVIIVLATGKSKPDGPHDNPNDPQNFQEMNDMHIGPVLESTPYSYSVTLDQKWKEDKPKTLLTAQADKKDVYTPVNPTEIPAEVTNNMWIDTVMFNVTLASQNMAHMVVYDKAKTEFMTPKKVFDRPMKDPQTSLQDTFSPITKDKFVFQIKDRSTGKELFSTEKRKFVMQDKFKEFGF